MSGAYYVQTNLGGSDRTPMADPAIAAYRVNAAAAKFSRVIAAQLYGEHRPFGYLFGGSGGSYQTIGAAENTRGVWDGFVPFVMATPNAIPSVFTVRMHALRVLRKRNRFPAIMDAIDAGGSGNPYAGLNEEECAALREATLLGFPLRGWYAHATMGSGYFSHVAPLVPLLDPTYNEDFWSKPGYLGTDPDAGLAAARFVFDTTVTRCIDGFMQQLELAAMPDRDFADAHLIVLSGERAGESVPIATIAGRTLGFTLSADQALLDIDAFPWQADWYRTQVRAQLGARFDDSFALWFIDNAHHDDPAPGIAQAHAVSYGGALQQALRDVSAWVEQGIQPGSTRYTITDAQVAVPAEAAQRGGIQPVVELLANGGARTAVPAGEAVHFCARVEVPPGAGSIVAVEWCFAGSGDFSHCDPLAAPQRSLCLSATHTFTEPGTYFPIVRVTAQRDGDARTPYGRIQNLARVRVVVDA